jgi:hypothetical protein
LPARKVKLVEEVWVLNWTACQGVEGLKWTIRTSWAISFSFKKGTGGCEVVVSAAMVCYYCTDTTGMRKRIE